jgi:hypothetical protein
MNKLKGVEERIGLACGKLVTFELTIHEVSDEENAEFKG